MLLICDICLPLYTPGRASQRTRWKREWPIATSRQPDGHELELLCCAALMQQPWTDCWVYFRVSGSEPIS